MKKQEKMSDFRCFFEKNYTACYPGHSYVRITTREYVENTLWGYLYVLRMDKQWGKERVEDGKGV